MRFHRCIAATLLAVGAAGAWSQAADDVGLQVEANRTQVYLGESFVLTVKISGLDAPPDPDLAALTNCNVRFLDSQSQNVQQITIINGRMQKSGFVGRIFTYEVTPLQAGRFEAGPIALTLDKRLIRAPGPLVDVAGVEEQREVSVRIQSSRETVLVGEPFDITLVVAIRKLPGANAESDPLDPNDLPKLDVPFLEAKPIPGLDGPDVQAFLRERVVAERRQAGFAINNYTVRQDPFSNLFNFDPFRSEAPAHFGFQRAAATRDGADRWEYSLTLHYVPKEEKSYAFGPVTFKGPVVTEVRPSGEAASRRVLAVGPACTVRVVPPPETDRPPSYVGAIGSNLVVEARLDTQSCRVGDPLSLTLTIAGAVSLRNVYPPAIDRQADLARDFKVYEDRVQSSADESRKTYVYTIRPSRDGTLEVPPIEASYYDTVARAYKTVRSQAIPLKVNPAPQVAEDMIIAAASNPAAAPVQTVQPASRIVAPLDVAPTGPASEPLALAAWHVTVLAGGPLLYLATLAGRALSRRRRASSAKRRRHQAMHQGLELLDRVAATATHDPRAARQMLCQGIRKFVAGCCGRPEDGITPDDARAALRTVARDPAEVDELCNLLERHYNAGFVSGAVQRPDELSQDSRRASLLLRKLAQATLALLLLGATAGRARADSDVERWFTWDEANARMSVARTPADFMAAAQSYQDLVDAGVRNGPVFYNLGTALLKAGQYRNATAALLLAEIRTGTTPEVRRNLALALAGENPVGDAALPWYRVPLAWHFGIPLRVRLDLAIGAFGLLWLGLILRSLTVRRLAGLLTLAAILLLAAFGSSVVTSLGAESHLLARARVPQAPLTVPHTGGTPNSGGTGR